MEDLTKLIEEAKEKYKDSSKYTVASWDAYQQALAAAEKITGESSPAEVQKAYADLEIAIKGIKERASQATLDDLSAVVKEAEASIEAGKTSEQLEKLVKEANGYIANPEKVGEE